MLSHQNWWLSCFSFSRSVRPVAIKIWWQAILHMDRWDMKWDFGVEAELSSERNITSGLPKLEFVIMISLVWPVWLNSQLVSLARCTWQCDLDCCARSSWQHLVRWWHEWFLTTYIGFRGHCAWAVVDTMQLHGSYGQRWSRRCSWCYWATTDSIRQQRSLGKLSSTNTSAWLSCRLNSICT